MFALSKLDAIKIILAIFDFNNHLTIKQLSHTASCNVGKYFPSFSYLAIISKHEKNIEKKIAKYEKLGKYSPYCSRHRVITIAYWVSS